MNTFGNRLINSLLAFGVSPWIKIASMVFLLSAIPDRLFSAEEKPAEIPAIVDDRWEVVNDNYGKRWNVDSANLGEKWSVKPKRFEDGLGETSDSRGIVVHRGLVVDEEVFPRGAPEPKKADNKTDKKAAKKNNGKKKQAGITKDNKKMDSKKVSAKKTSDTKAKPKTADAAKKSGGGKKGSYKKYSLKVNDKPREYYVYTPPGVPKGSKIPAVIAFHGFESDANGLRWLIKPDSWADKHKYMVIYPNAVRKSWNVGKGNGTTNKETDDWAFSKALYSTLIKRHPIDTKRLYTMGFSNGAQMVALWTCKMADKIAAAGMVAHTMNIPGCKPSHHTPIALIHGMQDNLAPYKGGGKHKLASHADSVEFFKKVNGATAKKEPVKHGKSYKCDTWKNSAKKTEVIDCKMYSDGHSWPGGVEFMVDILGTTNKELNATDFLFRFFGKYQSLPLPRKAPG